MKILLKTPWRFEKALIKNGFSKRAFSQKVGLSYFMIFQISKGNRNPSPSTAQKICSILNMDFDDLFYIEKEKETI